MKIQFNTNEIAIQWHLIGRAMLWHVSQYYKSYMLKYHLRM